MMMLSSGVKVPIAAGVTDLRKGTDGFAMLVQGVLREDPFSGHLIAFRRRKANLIKAVFPDGNGLCRFTKRFDQGRFVWPQADDRGGRVVLRSAQLSMLAEGMDWRAPERVRRPQKAGRTWFSA